MEEQVEKVEKMYLVKEFGTKKLLECVNPDLLQKFGWCYLLDFPERHEDKNWKGDGWGMCSPSCDTELIQVWIKDK